MRSRRRSRERLTCRLTPSIGAGAPGARCPFRPPDDVPIQGRREGGNKEREQHGSPSTEESACYWCPSVGESGISNPSSMNSSATEQEDARPLQTLTSQPTGRRTREELARAPSLMA